MSEHPYRPLPKTIEGITAQWLTAALQARYPEAVAEAIQIVDVIRGTSTKIRVRLRLNEAGRRFGIPETVIVKAGFEDHSDNMYYMYEREVRGYRDVWPVLHLPSPTPYFDDWDPQARHGIIVMEDLDARGVLYCNALEPQSHEQVAARLSVLAEYHARTLGSPELAPGGKWDWVENHLNALLIFVEENMTQEVWDYFCGLPRGGAFSRRFHDRDRAFHALMQMKKLIDSLPHAIIHGDTHLGNLYIEPDGTPGFYDSLVGRAPPMMEVAYHIVCAVDLADRPRWERSLVQHYLGEQRRHGGEAPGFEEAMHQYAVFLIFGYYIFLINDPVFQAEIVNTAYSARFNAAMLDHDTFALIETI